MNSFFLRLLVSVDFRAKQMFEPTATKKLNMLYIKLRDRLVLYDDDFVFYSLTFSLLEHVESIKVVELKVET